MIGGTNWSEMEPQNTNQVDTRLLVHDNTHRSNFVKMNKYKCEALQNTDIFTGLFLHPVPLALPETF